MRFVTAVRYPGPHVIKIRHINPQVRRRLAYTSRWQTGPSQTASHLGQLGTVQGSNAKLGLPKKRHLLRLVKPAGDERAAGNLTNLWMSVSTSFCLYGRLPPRPPKTISPTDPPPLTKRVSGGWKNFRIIIVEGACPPSLTGFLSTSVLSDFPTSVLEPPTQICRFHRPPRVRVHSHHVIHSSHVFTVTTSITRWFGVLSKRPQ